MKNKLFAFALACVFCTSMASVPVTADSADTLGDADGDGIVNAQDAAEILVRAASLGTGVSITPEETAVMDVNGNGDVNAGDASILLIYAANAGASADYPDFSKYAAQRMSEPNCYGAQYVSMILGDIYTAFSDGTYGYEPITFLITSPAELDAFVEKMHGISESFSTRTYTYAIEERNIPLTDTVAKYDDEWFRKQDLIMVIAQESATQYYHNVRGITENEDGSLTVNVDRIVPEASEQTMSSFAIFVETNKAVEFASAINVEMTDFYFGSMDNDTPRKDFAYYLSLSDYEVYAEYCETYGPFYGYEAQAELPAEEDLPDYYIYRRYVESEGDQIAFWADCTTDLEDVYWGLQYYPELFGFPKEWSRTREVVDHEDNISEEPFPLIFLNPTGGVNYNGVKYRRFDVEIWLDDVLKIDQNYTEEIYDDTIDMYRICLTLENSHFAKQYKHPEEVFHWYSIPTS